MSYYIRQHPDSGLRLAYAFDGEPGLRWEVSVGLRKSDQALVDAVNGVLDKLIADGTLTAIYQRYGVEHRVPARPRQRKDSHRAQPSSNCSIAASASTDVWKRASGDLAVSRSTSGWNRASSCGRRGMGSCTCLCSRLGASSAV